MFRKYWTFTIIVCILSFFLYQNASFAKDSDDMKLRKDELANRKGDTERFKDEYNKIHGQVATLINNYDATKAAVEEGKDAIVFRAGAAIIATGAAYLSGGSYAPGAWLAFYALKKTIETISLDSNQYLDAMGAAISVMDIARDNMNASYSGGTVNDYVKGSMYFNDLYVWATWSHP